MLTGIGACNCLRSIKRVRRSPRNERLFHILRSSPGPLVPLSRFRRDIHACRTVLSTRNSLRRTIHTETGFGNKPTLKLCRTTAGHFWCSPANSLGSRGFLTTSVSRSQTPAVESDQRPQGTLEDALPADDTSLSPRHTEADLVEAEKNDIKALRQKCRQSRGFKLDIRFSEFSKLFGEETCRVDLSMPGQEAVKVTASALEKQEAEREACLLLIAKLKETGIWETFSSPSSSQPQSEVVINDDLHFNIQHATRKLRKLARIADSFLDRETPETSPPETLPPERQSITMSNVYRKRRSMILARDLKHIRESRGQRASTLQSTRAGLPVNTLKQQILDLVNNHTYSLIVAETGSGKSTQVPQIILDDAIDRRAGGHCNVLCVQPRRVAAQFLARRVAHERLDQSGKTVGHMVRFDYQMPAKCGAITYCTTGVMLNMLQNPSDPLALYSHIILDEVHVRDIGIDFVMLLLKRRVDQLRLTGAPTPKIVVMSATLDVDLFTSYFRNEGPDGTLLPAPHISIPGRQYHVQRNYLDEVLETLKTSPNSESFVALLKEGDTAKFLKNHYKRFPPPNIAEDPTETALDATTDDLSKDHSPDPTAAKTHDEDPIIPLGLICATIFHILKTTKGGAILVFLPGMQQLLSVEGMLNNFAGKMELNFQDENLFRILKLHSELPEELQKLPLKVPDGCRRILLSTDISEASLTIPDVEYVVDSGRVNQLISDQRSLSNRMALCWISQSSSSQRAGRAGRVKNGQYYFLGTQQRYNSLRVTNAPEILRTDIQDACLRAKHIDPESTISEFFKGALEPPGDDKVNSAVQYLERMQAINLNGGERITHLGQHLLQLPLHPLLGKLVLLGMIFRCLDPLLILGVIGLDGDLFQRSKTEAQQMSFRNRRHAFAKGSASDQISTINAFKAIRKEWQEKGPSAAADFAYSNFLYFNDYREAYSAANQILEHMDRRGFIDLSRTTTDKTNHQFGGLEYNTNSDNALLIKTLLLNCLSPRIANPRTYKNGNAFQYSTHSEGDKPTVYGFSPSCDGNRSGSVAVYGRKKQFSPNMMVISELSLVSPLSACLFGSRQKMDCDSVLVEDFLQVKLNMKGASVPASKAVAHVVDLRHRISKGLRTYHRLLFTANRLLDDKDNRLMIQILRDELSAALVQTVTDVLGHDLHRIIPPETVSPRWETVIVEGEIIA